MTLAEKIPGGLKHPVQDVTPQAWSVARGLVSWGRRSHPQGPHRRGSTIGAGVDITFDAQGYLDGWVCTCQALSVSNWSSHVTLCPWNLLEVSHSSHPCSGFGSAVSF